MTQILLHSDIVMFAMLHRKTFMKGSTKTIDFFILSLFLVLLLKLSSEQVKSRSTDFKFELLRF